MADLKIIEELINRDPFINYVGIKTRIVEPGKAEAILDIQEKHLRLGGILNGGVISTLVDTAGGAATLSLSERNQVTINLDINFLAPISKSPAKAIGTVIKTGKTIYVARVEIFDGDGKLCAYATGSWFIFKD
ncbi:MAG: PaaI family thioesterase [Thermoplasmatales archaeon]